MIVNRGGVPDPVAVKVVVMTARFDIVLDPTDVVAADILSIVRQ